MTTAASIAEHRRSRTALVLARLALALGVASAAAALLAGAAYRLQWVALGSAFMMLRWGTYGGLACAVIALIAIVWLGVAGAPRGRAMAAVALLLGVGVSAPPVYMFNQAQHLPKIHDISTDTDDPPSFIDVLPLRAGAKNPSGYQRETAAEQRRGYPDIAPLHLNVPPAQAFQRAEQAARAMGWQIVATRPDALRIEATDTTLMFGFKDDIVIRVRALGSGSVVHVRSLSRIGGSDIGTNARRVRGLLRRIEAE